ncbi:MAG: YARHG domain-containing protein [Clostridium sp.]
MFCTNCGKKNSGIAKFCTGCGSELQREDKQATSPVVNELKSNNNASIKNDNTNKGLKIVVGILLTVLFIGVSTFIGYKLTNTSIDTPKNTTIKQTNNKVEVKKDENIKIFEDKNLKGVSLKGKSDPNGYIIPDSNSRVLREDELKNVSKADLAYIRNEIFARNGYIFKSSEYATYFGNKSWYIENGHFTGNESELNEFEKQNVTLIRSLEGR